MYEHVLCAVTIHIRETESRRKGGGREGGIVYCVFMCVCSCV